MTSSCQNLSYLYHQLVYLFLETTVQTVGLEEVPSSVYLKQMPFQLPVSLTLSARVEERISFLSCIYALISRSKSRIRYSMNVAFMSTKAK